MKILGFRSEDGIMKHLISLGPETLLKPVGEEEVTTANKVSEARRKNG